MPPRVRFVTLEGVGGWAKIGAVENICRKILLVKKIVAMVILVDLSELFTIEWLL